MAAPSTRLLEALAAVIAGCLLVAVGVHRRTGDTGLVRVADDQVAVVVDRWSGSRRLVMHPGRLLYWPLLEKVYLFDRSPHALRMEGSRAVGSDVVPQLIARARDGSSFWYATVEVHYALLPEAAAEVLDDAGPGIAVDRALLSASARSILRDELGRWTSEEVARGECVASVTSAAVAKLNAILRPHGAEVLGIALGRPAFDEAYEEAIRRRATFAQESEQLEAQLVRMRTDQMQKENAARKDKEVELRKLEGALVRDLGAARAESIRVRQDADDFFRAEVASGEAARREKEAQASLVQERHVAAARAVYREGLDLQSFGNLSVRAALVRKLAGIQFELVPYNRDPSQRTVEYAAPSAARGKP